MTATREPAGGAGSVVMPKGWAIVRALPQAQQLTVAVACAVLSIACVGRFGFDARAFVGALLASTLVISTATDLDRRLIPNAVVLPALAIVLAAQIAFYPDQAIEWLLASLGAAAFLLIPGLIVAGGMGMGDVKLAALLGAALGKSVIVALFGALMLGAAYAVFVLLREGLGARRTTIAYGPFLAVGGLVVLFLGGHWQT